MLTRNRLLTGISMLAAASFVAPVSAQDTIKIGELNSYKVFAAFLEPYKKGWELAVEEVNAAGGVLGKKFNVIVEDSGGNPTTALNAARKLIAAQRYEEADTMLIQTHIQNEQNQAILMQIVRLKLEHERISADLELYLRRLMATRRAVALGR